MFLDVDCLDEWYLMNLFLHTYCIHNDRNFNEFLYLTNLHASLINNFRNLHFNYLYISNYLQNLPDDFYLFWWKLNYLLHCHYLLNDLWNCNDSLFNLNERDDLLYNFFDNLDACFNQGNNLRSLFVTYNFYYFFNNLRHCHSFLTFYYLFNYFLNNNFDRFHNLFFCFNVSNHFFDDLYWF